MGTGQPTWSTQAEAWVPKLQEYNLLSLLASRTHDLKAVIVLMSSVEFLHVLIGTQLLCDPKAEALSPLLLSLQTLLKRNGPVLFLHQVLCGVEEATIALPSYSLAFTRNLHCCPTTRIDPTHPQDIDTGLDPDCYSHTYFHFSSSLPVFESLS